MRLFRPRAHDRPPSGTRPPDPLHRPPGVVERMIARVEAVPRRRLYVILAVVTWFCLTFLVGMDTRPIASLGLGTSVQDYHLGSVARSDVYAQRSVTYEDPVRTEAARQQAASSVQPVYRLDRRVPSEVEAKVRGFFDRVGQIRSSHRPTESRVSEVVGAAPFHLPRDVAASLLSMSGDDFRSVEEGTLRNLSALYRSTAVAGGSLQQGHPSVITLSEARLRLAQASGGSGEVGRITGILSRDFLQPNYVVDRAATEKARREAASRVRPVMGSVQQGERVLSRGEVVDREKLAQLKALGKADSTKPWTALLGVALVVSAEMGVAWYFLERFRRRILKTKVATRLVLASALTILFTAVARAFVYFSLNPYLIPLAGFSILGTILLGPRMMFLLVVICSVNFGIIGQNDDLLTATLMLSSGFAVYTVVRADSRMDLLRAGLFVAVVMAVVTFAVSLIGGTGLHVALRQGGYGLINGFLSLMIAMVMLPLLESTFNFLTPMRLLELSDPGHPLLQQLLRRAPGTFSHSMQVGNLAENAAERIEANALLARVGSYYHDIGKIEHPLYFIENQIGRSNPHENLSPMLSAKILRRHVKDGVELARSWGLPEEIVEIIAQHHGNTRIEYFYRKALKESQKGGEAVTESDFRYHGGLPRSKEAGIVMLADSVEATVRSLEKPTPKRIEDIVSYHINSKLNDGQFDRCDLTVREIQQVGDAIREAMIGFLGPRIEYPEALPPGKPKPEPTKHTG